MPSYRSWLFVPGDDEKKIAKAQKLPVDAIIYDLEDSVIASRKGEARAIVKNALQLANIPSYIRVNDLSSPYFITDLQETVCLELDGIILPKSSTSEDVKLAERFLGVYESENQLPKDSIEIVPLIESAEGLLNSLEIAKASPRVKRMTFGAVDFTLDIGAETTKGRQEILFARSQLVIVSRAGGLEPPIDTVYTNVNDTKGFYEDALLGKQLGFKGKLLIHPNQIDTVNNLFFPSEKELGEARQMVAAFEKAVNDGKGAVEFNGKMVDLPVVEQARNLLKRTGEMV